MIARLLLIYFMDLFLFVGAGSLSSTFSSALPSAGGADQPFNSGRGATTSPSARNDSPRFVFMHIIVGNTYDFTVDDWRTDIRQIGSGGVDAIALNFGPDSWQNDQLRSAYSAASGSGVKLFLSPDFSVFPCDVDSVVDIVNQFSGEGTQFKIDGRPLISSYLGKCLGNNGWKEIKRRTNGYLMPFIAEIEGQFHDWNSLDSWFCWGCAWPQGDADKTTADDRYYLQQLGPSIKYTTSVSPWMFTHYEYKNFYQRGDDWLISGRWEQLVAMREQIPMVEMITWNDFGESDYYGTIKGLQPAGTTWANGFSHLPFFELSKYYITAYKTGNYPTITEDVIYFWARPHPAQATASSDRLARPSGYDYAEDYLWALVLATQPGQVILSCGSSTQQFLVNHGVNKLKLPLSPGKITVSMTRNGKTLIRQTTADFIYSVDPELYNYNVYIGKAKAGSVGSSPTVVPPPTNTPYPTSTTQSTILVPTPTSPPSAPTSPEGLWSYYGCVEEGTSGSRRALTGPFSSRPDMTPELCQKLCIGYSFSGIEYGRECFCGNSLNNNGANGNMTYPSKCSMPCAGDPGKSCGGEWALSVFTTLNKTPIAQSGDGGERWLSLGCYTDSESRFLKGSVSSRPGMTSRLCMNECSRQGFGYAAIEYGLECYCGYSIERTSDGAGVMVDEQECNMSCDGNSGEKCGGSWRANVFSSSDLGAPVLRRHRLVRQRRVTLGNAVS